MAIIFLLIIHWYSSLFFQSVFHHRYAAHAMFTMTKGWEKAFYIGCYVTQGSSYISAYAYGIMHRLHHAHTDTKEDPHSPGNSNNVFAMMWQTRNNYFDIFTGKTNVEQKYTIGLPKWEAFDKIAHSPLSRIAWCGFYVFLYYLLAPSWWYYLLLPLHFGMGAIQGAVVNWLAHVVGYVNFKVNNTSKNLIPVDFIFWGEAYHNNHHKHPSRPNNSVKWFEVDAGYWVMKMLDQLKVIRLRTHKAPRLKELVPK
ncbi:acyl-CoA desaturase [Rhodocytophaga aerolata]|uniref:Acyl-CoA desaturase n=1 Tax=Rhodocytophaga aerolata TaxID=455078 RepID=A0ABT8RJI3_9BACT|nr:acyl-CoA desaturase [Rhodocytophaga aerolata]MDO1451584.1 acyl-CoA desaturase [Rhodocytophaga aerolata]